ncbi:LacI family DNA-binding transcriptional regulator [Qaidamihabitans albus]|uniref:LacI family DNA-binding transcriptional regulator n=1 Tax=Qaidamihabitans albus TaxID=2795733 RepID=UPI0018F23B93|nr:LacI family DNA-binding transcriptional regulator [Qaidamihabitans albus]
MPAARGGRPPTIRSVAEHAGVSKSLVSLVLRGSPRVSEARRRAVLDAVRELGYRPNATARHLTERRSHTVGVLLNDLRNPWFVECLEGLNSVFHAHDLRMFLGDGRLDRRTDEALTQGFLELPVDGMVLVGTMPESAVIAEAAATLPTVVASSRDFDLPGVPVFANDDRHGAALAVRHLADLGHRHIAHLAGSFGAVARLRRESYEQTMRAHGLGEHIRVERCDLTEEGGYRAAVRLLTGPRRPTALFAVNDMACVGALSAAEELGIAVPGELSLVGYDNTYLARIRHLSLTTVDNASHEVGRNAAKALLDRIAGRADGAGEHLLPPELRIRSSTAPPTRLTTS